MSENKFTAGPWEVVENPPSENGGTATSIYGGANNYVADVYCGYVGSESMSRTEASANARLIAAAPDLLEALEAVDNGYCCGHDLSLVINEVRAAIAKARGES